MKNTLIYPVVFIIVHLFWCLPAGAAASEEFHSAMARHLSCFPLQLVNVNRQEISIINEDLCLATIYAAKGMKPLWVSENGPDKNAAVILQVLENAESEGLRASDYNVEGIKSLWQSSKPDHLARLDTQLTLNFIKYAHDVSYGRIIPFKTDPKLFAEAGDSHFKPVQVVEQALAAPDLARYLADLPPSHEYYRKLRTALQFYRNIDLSNGWNKVEDGKTLHPGDMDERIRQIRQLLPQTGDLDLEAEKEILYDEQLVPVIKKFQKQFGLEEDGIIGRKTLAALNTSPAEIISKIILNMARWRWQEHELGRRYIMVNIANYDLKAVEDGQEILEMAVIVGKLQHQTPVFSHRVQYVDFNPFWNIPPSIARNEELPELRKDRFYLVNRRVRLFSNWQTDGVELDSTAINWQSVTPREMNRYKLRQDPGPWNALGPVKLVFPNKYNVYIHGTPAQELFEHNKRNFSHGCIRASQPLALVKFALSGEKQDWSMEKIQEIIALEKRKVVNLSTPLPIHITYQTVWVDNQGIINFNEDTYGRDRKLAEILFASSDNAASTTNNVPVNE
ncbi:MAG: L,D-transpeptidase family protein [Desulfobulbaceae bacterium]|nr:L,D-transpeptidase family protein [Desulfobulbaceae bacterium]